MVNVRRVEGRVDGDLRDRRRRPASRRSTRDRSAADTARRREAASTASSRSSCAPVPRCRRRLPHVSSSALGTSSCASISSRACRPRQVNVTTCCGMPCSAAGGASARSGRGERREQQPLRPELDALASVLEGVAAGRQIAAVHASGQPLSASTIVAVPAAAPVGRLDAALLQLDARAAAGRRRAVSEVET